MRRSVDRAAQRASASRQVTTALGGALEVGLGSEAKSRTKWLSRASEALYRLTFEDPALKDTSEETRRLDAVSYLIEIEPELESQDGRLNSGRLSKILFDVVGADRTARTPPPAP
jgi:hypothetical protein